MITGVSTASTSGNSSAINATLSGGGLKGAGSAGIGSGTTSSSVVSLSSSAVGRQSSADALGLYSPGRASAVALTDRLRQAADENTQPKTSQANPMGDVMLMLLIAQAKGYLSSAYGGV